MQRFRTWLELVPNNVAILLKGGGHSANTDNSKCDKYDNQHKSETNSENDDGFWGTCIIFAY